jgi:hypothetical protein
MSTRTITLPADQWEAILEAVQDHWDEGPPGEGWQGSRLSAASAALSTTLAQPEPGGLPPRVGHILRLAEIIREVDGNHDKGAAALAEAILSHPGSRWSPTIEPVPVAQRPWEREKGWRDPDGECWWCPPDGPLYWQMANPAMVYGGWLLPPHAIPVPTPLGCETGTHPV